MHFGAKSKKIRLDKYSNAFTRVSVVYHMQSKRNFSDLMGKTFNKCKIHNGFGSAIVIYETCQYRWRTPNQIYYIFHEKKRKLCRKMHKRKPFATVDYLFIHFVFLLISNIFFPVAKKVNDFFLHVLFFSSNELMNSVRDEYLLLHQSLKTQKMIEI